MPPLLPGLLRSWARRPAAPMVLGRLAAASLKAVPGCLSSVRVGRDAHLTRLVARLPAIGPRIVYRLQQAGGGFGSDDWAGIVRDARRARPRRVGVDVFDTCVVRALAGEGAVEYVIDHVGAATGPGDDAAGRVERALCRPVPGVAEALTEIRRAEAEVVFVSDTDRSSALLTEILRSHQVFVDGDRLVASCEEGATKSDGDLFPRALGGGEPGSGNGSSVWHVGNHPWSDVAMAAAAGIRPRPVTEADANRYERAMAVDPAGYGPAVAGAARLARLRIEHDLRSGRLSGQQARLRILGADVAGQAMMAFTLWVAERCRDEGIEHLGFLARDGELPLEVARALPADHWEGRSLRYLHCSRLTWSLAAASVTGVERWLVDGTSDDGAFLHTNRHEVPFEALLSRIGLAADDVTGLAAHRQLAGLDPASPLPSGAAPDWEALLADPAVQQRIAERADERLKLIVDRLRADGVPAGRFGLVDVGWRGRLATQVSAVLSQVVGHEPVHFHFGGDKVLADVDDRVPIRRFAFDGVSDPHPIDAPVSCIETLTASGKPRVVEYRRGPDGQVDLVFDDPPAGSDGDRTELWAGALQAAALFPSRATLDGWGLRPGPLVGETVAVLDHWWNRPTDDEVHALEGLTFEHDEAGTTLRPLITPYRLADMASNGGRPLRQWPQGSAVASRPPMSVVARLVRLVRLGRQRRALYGTPLVAGRRR